MRNSDKQTLLSQIERNLDDNTHTKIMEKNISISVRPGPDVIEPLAEHNATIIFIHGLGDKPETLHEPIDQWRSNGHLDNIKFVLPHAPIIPFTAV